mgnify:CR=1 FL=1
MDFRRVGASANNAVYFALLKPGDKIMGMNLSHGGHLTHGSPVNLSGRYYEVIAYGVDKETEQISCEGTVVLTEPYQVDSVNIDLDYSYKVRATIGPILFEENLEGLS